ncbi:hypothetical protein I5H06_gp15 [Mycobacterium phage SirPhilip]|uniref:Uncharacterized protein n=1 Tax=Mycobacterium phage SirPhilip TaxID=2015824 RepID=A0A222ZLP6_9CAUD|nr:hypothetical protein I5H06_gp15 [Mycobacterium phage SirPhilip]ASR85289.1 hypothetical protein SEA_SIRPHILIP_87 [Mycobacterium phage SirPhilip]
MSDTHGWADGLYGPILTQAKLTQAKYTHTIPFRLGGPTRQTSADRLRRRASIDDSYAIAMRLVFGIDVVPARPTVREALVDAWDALRALVLVVAAVAGELAAAVAAGLTDALVFSWLDPLLDALYTLLDRWDALRAPYRWGRIPGPVVRFWSSDWTHIATQYGDREPVGAWLRRVLLHVWRAVLHG